MSDHSNQISGWVLLGTIKKNKKNKMKSQNRPNDKRSAKIDKKSTNVNLWPKMSQTI